jgi:hypothetical protein
VRPRRALAVSLERLGVQRPAWKLWEWARTIRALPSCSSPRADKLRTDCRFLHPSFEYRSPVRRVRKSSSLKAIALLTRYET